jgi:hypothetical protein
VSSPRDRRDDPDGPDGPGGPGTGGSGWREPAHLGDGAPGDDAPRDSAPGGGTPYEGPAPHPAPWEPPAPPSAPRGGGPSGPRRPRTPGAVEQVFRYQGDTVGVQGWALQHGWTISDGSAPEDAVLRELIASAPVRLTKDHRPAGVLRGRAGWLDMVAFDVVYASGRLVVPEFAVTAVPVLVGLPALRLSPARLWKHRTGGLLQVPSGDPEFDTRWVLLTAEDTPVVRGLVGDPALRGMLLATDDGDEFWSAAGHVAAIRPDGHRPELVEHHARLLTAVVGALAAGA